MLLDLGPRSKNNKLVIAEYYVFGDRGVSSHCQISIYILLEFSSSSTYWFLLTKMMRSVITSNAYMRNGSIFWIFERSPKPRAWFLFVYNCCQGDGGLDYASEKADTLVFWRQEIRFTSVNRRRTWSIPTCSM